MDHESSRFETHETMVPWVTSRRLGMTEIRKSTDHGNGRYKSNGACSVAGNFRQGPVRHGNEGAKRPNPTGHAPPDRECQGVRLHLARTPIAGEQIHDLLPHQDPKLRWFRVRAP